MSTTAQRRAELASFLRARRARLDPVTVGLPPAGPRRRAGLRREEVATLSGVRCPLHTPQMPACGRDTTMSPLPRQSSDPARRKRESYGISSAVEEP